MSADTQRILRETQNLRVGPQTAAYVAAQIQSSTREFFVMGVDALTGRPLRRKITPDMLSNHKEKR